MFLLLFLSNYILSPSLSSPRARLVRAGAPSLPRRVIGISDFSQFYYGILTSVREYADAHAHACCRLIGSYSLSHTVTLILYD